MGKLSDFVHEDYVEELAIIKDESNIWSGVGWVSFALIVMWLIDFFTGAPWGRRMYAFAFIALVVVPLLWRAWMRHKVADDLRRHREIQMDMKLNALLGLVNIKDDVEDE